MARMGIAIGHTSMASTTRFPIEHGYVQLREHAKIYSLCFFDPGELVPRVQLIEAADDAEAIAEARSEGRSSTREVWDRHRLVAGIRHAQPNESFAAVSAPSKVR